MRGRSKKRLASGIATGLLALALAGCGGGEAETPAAATQRGIDRSVADIRAAEDAMRGPVEVSRSVGELTGKQSSVAEADTKRTGQTRVNARAGSPASPASDG